MIANAVTFADSRGARSMSPAAEMRIERMVYNGVEPDPDRAEFNGMSDGEIARALVQHAAFNLVVWTWEKRASVLMRAIEVGRSTSLQIRPDVVLSCLSLARSAPSIEERNSVIEHLGLPDGLSDPLWKKYETGVRAEVLIYLESISDMSATALLDDPAALCEFLGSDNAEAMLLLGFALLASQSHKRDRVQSLINYLSEHHSSVYDMRAGSLKTRMDVFRIRHALGMSGGTHAALVELWEMKIAAAESSLPCSTREEFDDTRRLYRHVCESAPDPEALRQAHHDWHDYLQSVVSSWTNSPESKLSAASVTTGNASELAA